MEISVYIQIDPVAFKESLSNVHLTSLENYQLTIEGHRIRFKDTFESLICLNSIKNIQSFWFQEETARKILKTFRGRALLADEVGLGKTIEALMVLKEYIQRSIVKSALILTPTPLVTQWKEELKTKFGLNFPSTDDSDYHSWNQSFWKEDFILASINLAKSKKNFSTGHLTLLFVRIVERILPAFTFVIIFICSAIVAAKNVRFVYHLS